MARSRKKKTKKKKTSKKNIGKTLGIIALIISVGSLGLSLVDVFLPLSGPKIYSNSYDGIYSLNGIVTDQFDELDISFKTLAWQRIVFDFSCEVYLYPDGSSNLILYYVIHTPSDLIYPDSKIRVSTSEIIFISGYMRHIIESSEMGEYIVRIFVSIDDEYTSSSIWESLSTVTVY